MKQGERLGLLGGTFDPVHLGHLAAAARVCEAFSLSALWVIPAAFPPHKRIHADGQDISSYGHRVAMLELALAGQAALIVSRLEAELPGPSYTIKTLQAIGQSVEGGTRLYFIIGADAFVEIPTWKEYRRLPLLANFVVINRPESPFARVAGIISTHFPDWRYDPVANCWEPPAGGKPIHYLEMTPVPISSTGIREKVRSGASITGLVPDAVAEYIQRHGLYGAKSCNPSPDLHQ